VTLAFDCAIDYLTGHCRRRHHADATPLLILIAFTPPYRRRCCRHFFRRRRFRFRDASAFFAFLILTPLLTLRFFDIFAG
jgi:hypothetical protein